MVGIYVLKSQLLKGGYIYIYIYEIFIGLTKGDAWSAEYSSYRDQGMVRD